MSDISMRAVRYTMVLAAGLILAGCTQQAPPQAQQTVQRHAFWPDAPDLPRIQYLTSFNSSADLRAARSGMQQLVFGREAPEEMFIAKPYGLAMWNGRIYVTDVRGRGVMVLDLRTRQTRLMGAAGAYAVQRAVDVTVAPDGRKYVADAGRSAIAVFSAEERFEMVFTMPGGNPVSVAVHENLLYVVDQTARDVKVIDRFSGQLLRTVGGPGNEDGRFMRPIAVSTDRSGNVFVTDIIRARVQKFDSSGQFVLGFGESGNRPGFFDKPKHNGVGSDGIVYTVDAAFNNVQLFDEQGKVMMFFGSPGGHPGAMDLPAGIAVHEGDLDLFEQYIHPAFQAERLILVTNQFGPNRVSVYAMGHLREGRTLADINPNRAIVAPIEAAAPVDQLSATGQ